MSKIDHTWHHEGTEFQIQGRFLQMKEGRQNPVFYFSLMTGRSNIHFQHLATLNITGEGHYRPDISRDARVINAVNMQAIAAFFDLLSRDSGLWTTLIRLMEEKGLRYK